MPGAESDATPVGAEGVHTGTEARLDPRALEGLDDAQVLAFLAHGHFEPGLARPSMVALAPWSGRPDGLVTCADIEALAPRTPPLMLFVTCRSAVGPRAAGDVGITDLGGAALLGGASCALVASSDIALDAAFALVESFMRRMEAGDPPDEALRLGRNSLARKPGFDDPFFLDSLRLFGVAHLPLIAGRGR